MRTTIFVIRRGAFFLQGINGWGTRSTATEFDTLKEATKHQAIHLNTTIERYTTHRRPVRTSLAQPRYL